MFRDYSNQNSFDIEDVLDMMLFYRQTVLPILGFVYDLVRVKLTWASYPFCWIHDWYVDGMSDGWIMIKCVNMVPLTLMYMMGLTFKLLGAVISGWWAWRVLMTLLILTTRCRDDLDFMLIEKITLFIYDLDFCWISLILRTFYSSLVISVSVDLVDIEDI